MQVDELLKPFPIKEFHPFPRAMMGPGALVMIGPEAKKLGFRKILVMTTGLRGSDTVHKIVESLKWHGLETVLFDKVESNPKDYNVMDAVALYQETKCDSFVSIGGGSAHDRPADELQHLSRGAIGTRDTAQQRGILRNVPQPVEHGRRGARECGRPGR